MVKRVDSSGSRGITIVNEKSGLEEAYHNALDRSRKEYVLVEEKLEAAPMAETRTSVVYEAYRGWCSENGCYAENMRNFNQALRSIATVTRKRPVTGGGATTLLCGYRISGVAQLL